MHNDGNRPSTAGHPEPDPQTVALADPLAFRKFLATSFRKQTIAFLSLFRQYLLYLLSSQNQITDALSTSIATTPACFTHNHDYLYSHPARTPSRNHSCSSSISPSSISSTLIHSSTPQLLNHSSCLVLTIFCSLPTKHPSPSPSPSPHHPPHMTPKYVTRSTTRRTPNQLVCSTPTTITTRHHARRTKLLLHPRPSKQIVLWNTNVSVVIDCSGSSG